MNFAKTLLSRMTPISLAACTTLPAGSGSSTAPLVIQEQGNSTVAATIEPAPFDQLFFDQFRIGKWPNYSDSVQFDRKPETLDQFFRSVPRTRNCSRSMARSIRHLNVTHACERGVPFFDTAPQSMKVAKSWPEKPWPPCATTSCSA